MKRFYVSVVAVALLACAAVMTANAAYPVSPAANSHSNSPALGGEQWPTSGIRHPMAKVRYSGLRSYASGSNLHGNTPPSWGTDVQVSTDNPTRPHNEMAIASNPTNPLNFISGANDYGTT